MHYFETSLGKHRVRQVFWKRVRESETEISPMTYPGLSYINNTWRIDNLRIF